ncbi:MAG: DNA repair protein, partial [Proteobacteria bacterium]|nr:DNA repair protein [Pseudomonadota bacterium]
AVAETTDTAKVTTSRLAKAAGMKTAELTGRLIALGLLELRDERTYLTDKGKEAGGEFRMSPKFGPYFLWPENLSV